MYWVQLLPSLLSVVARSRRLGAAGSVYDAPLRIQGDIDGQLARVVVGRHKGREVEPRLLLLASWRPLRGSWKIDWGELGRARSSQRWGCAAEAGWRGNVETWLPEAVPYRGGIGKPWWRRLGRG